MQRLSSPRFVCTLLITAATSIASSAYAQAPPDPTFALGDKKDLKDVKAVTWTVTANAGLIATTGNSQSTSISAGGEATRKDKDNKFDALVAATYAHGTTRIVEDENGDGVIEPNELNTIHTTAAENALAKLRYDRYLTDLNALYITAIAGFDKPAGKEFQGGGQIGYSRGLYHCHGIDVLGEVGYDVSYLKLYTDESTVIHSARVFGGYTHKIGKAAELSASLEALFNLNTVTIGTRDADAFHDVRLLGLIALTTSFTSKVSLSASFSVRYDEFPAPLAEIGMIPFEMGFVPVADTVDTVTKVSLIVKFL